MAGVVVRRGEPGLHPAPAGHADHGAHAGQRGDAGGAEPVREGGRPAAVVPETGGFTYDLHRDRQRHRRAGRLPHRRRGRPDGVLRAVRSAMAVMARILGIPARVAVGFLVPDRIAPGTFEYSAWDLHAWPELFFPVRDGCGSSPRPLVGPRACPATRRRTCPWSTRPAAITTRASARSRAAARARARTPVSRPVVLDVGLRDRFRGSRWRVAPASSSSRSWRCSPGRCDARAGSSGSGAGPRRPGPSCGRPPRTSGCRGRRRARRAPPGSTSCATSGNPWATTPPSVPRTVPGSLPRRSGPGPDRPGARAVPLRPRGADAGSRRAPTWRPVWRRCTVGPRSARRRAEWWPRSVVGTRARRRPARSERPVEARYGGVVDHVG